MNMAESHDVDIISSSGNKQDKTVKKLLFKKSNKASNYLIPKARLVFTQLRKTFTKAIILGYFNLECHIRIKTNVSNYAISSVLSQLTLNHLSQWHQIAYYLQKMILGTTWYKTHNGKLLTIIKPFKIWQNYSKDCKYKVFVIINYNNFFHFIDIKTWVFVRFGGPKSFFVIVFE